MEGRGTKIPSLFRVYGVCLDPESKPKRACPGTDSTPGRNSEEYCKIAQTRSCADISGLNRK